MPPMKPDLHDDALSDSELAELGQFLDAAPRRDHTMSLAMLDGFLTGVVIGPSTVMPSLWLPRVWDHRNGSPSPAFANTDQAADIMMLVMRHHNAICRAFPPDEQVQFDPLFWRHPDWSVDQWCRGFLLAMQFDPVSWEKLLKQRPDWFSPLLALSGATGEPVGSQEQAVALANEIEPGLVNIHSHWLARRLKLRDAPNLDAPAPWDDGQDDDDYGPPGTVVRDGPKIGRNDPCPCGSGLKYKKCCGSRDESVTLH